jgi:acetyl esterase/lipase
MLIQVGSAETLLSDTIQLPARAGEAAFRVTLQIWPAMIHAWHLFHPQHAAGREALAVVDSFVQGAL